MIKEKRTALNARLTVVNVQQVSLNFIRISFTCDKPLIINPLWIGPHLKLLFPKHESDELIFPQRDENNKIIWQDGLRERVRTYSIRFYDQTLNQLLVDFAVHENGVATSWAQQAKIGHKIGLLGLGAKKDFCTSNLVLMGDISALPAICYTIEHKPSSVNVLTFVEVNDESDKNCLKMAEAVKTHWFIKDKNQLNQLIDSVLSANFDFSQTQLIWGGMESSLAQQMRHRLKQKYPELSSDTIQIISYWREGFAEGQFSHRD